MSNMSYCRFRNTEEDISDCIEALGEGNSLSKEEAVSAERMFNSVLEFFQDNRIIENYDKEQLQKVIEDCKEKEEK
ncbi:hypothetical protein [Clostridium felsineum]|uniref:Uncharacterized protein n=1 Tax=Clostridium felsineum TaxID=36839 RepID=A0A1S8KYH4_9CLOT|nr:hypothetical protein [Clostridium felsineum]URZ05964.1 hypothetical protein CLROS_012960 [Clostridium felsineum]URZ11001.1 hypothetical protein CROST_017170 [Clostridium felsineum]